ncbi:MAG TPA: hypothetical protein VMY42_14550, partial [Thermoguttaceae bacterium]|nr:hypothetical protein [Thermoguttaceae bacterium]
MRKCRLLVLLSMTMTTATALWTGLAMEQGALAQEKQPDYTSRVPAFTFADTLAEQEAQLKTNPLLLRFAESRK